MSNLNDPGWTPELEAALDETELHHLRWMRDGKKGYTARLPYEDAQRHLLTIARLRVDVARLQKHARDLSARAEKADANAELQAAFACDARRQLTEAQNEIARLRGHDSHVHQDHEDRHPGGQQRDRTMTRYTISWSNGRKDEADTYEAAKGLVLAAYPDAEIGHDGDLEDHGDRTLCWATEEDSVDDDGGRAVCSIYAREEVRS